MCVRPPTWCVTAAAMDELRRRRHFVDDDYTSAPPRPEPRSRAGGGACVRACGRCMWPAGRARARDLMSWAAPYCTSQRTPSQSLRACTSCDAAGTEPAGPGLERMPKAASAGAPGALEEVDWLRVRLESLEAALLARSPGAASGTAPPASSSSPGSPDARRSRPPADLSAGGAAAGAAAGGQDARLNSSPQPEVLASAGGARLGASPASPEARRGSRPP